ncbi:MAG: hypothetical protein M1828_004922 [Chrysothrix sp. TS-e1954]|nr:MAG: hypothetical protein M1828_004922 [Chrysothrix sp. TS-e1954]
MASQEEVFRTFAGRLATFEGPQQIAKRRASSVKKKKANTASWPHESPSPEELAKAGFYYKPTGTSTDNVVCFLCNKSLDGWEEGDNPTSEHLRNVPGCGWAINMGIERRSQDEDREEMNPMDDEMIEARRATFQDSWPHEHRKGWKCKTQKMVEAGWSYSPLPEADDCVHCFYCGVSLDGWEPKDDPWEEHKRRAPQCGFFSLVEEAAKVSKQPQTKAKKGRAPRASKASRMSTQSNATMQSDAPTIASLEDFPAEEGDTIMTTASTTSKATRATKKATSKTAAPKRPRAGTRSKKVETAQEPMPVETKETPEDDQIIEPTPQPEPKAKKGRQTKKRVTAQEDIAPAADDQVDESLVQPEKKRPTRTRGVKNQPTMEGDTSQTHTELDGEASIASSIPQPKPKRGRKRASDGTDKLESSVVVREQPIAVSPPIPVKKGRPTRKASAQIPAPIAPVVEQVDSPISPIEAEPEPKPKPKTKKGKKAQTVAVKDTVEAISEPFAGAKYSPTPEARHEPESAGQTSPQQVERKETTLEPEVEDMKEPEPEPIARSKPKTNAKAGRSRQRSPSPNPQPKASISYPRSPSPVPATEVPRKQSPPKAQRQSAEAPPSPSQSPQSSDAENKPPSSHPSQQKSSSLQNQANHQQDQDEQPAVRSPLADRTLLHTPDKSSRAAQTGLITTDPWTAVDLETAFLPSPTSQGDGDPISDKSDVRSVLGNLSSPEKQMTVEEWIMSNAAKAEEKLRRGCEGMIGRFESEGVRALNSLRGIE